jgi:P-type Mg2+ transporter
MRYLVGDNISVAGNMLVSAGVIADTAAAYERNTALSFPRRLIAALRVGEAAGDDKLDEVGPNEIAREKPPHWLFQLLACFKNPFILVLAVLAIIQYGTNPDDLRPVIIVCVMVAISVGLQFWQEYRSALAAQFVAGPTCTRILAELGADVAHACSP